MDTEKQGFFRDMKQLGEEYVTERINLLKLQGAEKAARMSAVFATGLVLAILGLFVLFFLSLLAVYAIAEATRNLFLGLGIVALFYFLIAVLVYVNRKSRIYPRITNAVIRMLFEKTENE